MPKSSSKDKKSKKSSKSKKSKSSDAAAPLSAPPPVPPMSTEFSAGALYERYAANSSQGLDRPAFLRMLKDSGVDPSKALHEITSKQAATGGAYVTPRTDFEAGRLFARYSNSTAGKGGDAGGLDGPALSHMLADVSQRQQAAHANHPDNNPYAAALPSAWGPGGVDPYSAAASAPAVLQQYDVDRSGALEPHEFRRLVADARAGRIDATYMAATASYPGSDALAGYMYGGGGGGVGGGGGWIPPMMGPYAPPAAPMGMGGNPPPFGSGAYMYGSSAGDASRALAAAMQYAEGNGSGEEAGEHDSRGDGSGMAPHSSSLMVAPSSRSNPSLLEAYHARLSGLTAAHARLMAKREVLVHRLARAAARREALASERRAVERETVAECESILHRLRSAESLRASLLDHGAQLVAGDVRAIDGFSSKLRRAAPAAFGGPLSGGRSDGEAMGDVLSPHGHGMEGAAAQAGQALSFLRGYPELCADADRLLAKPVADPEASLGPQSSTGSITSGADTPGAVKDAQGGLPRETAERAALLRRHQELLRLLGAKDALIALLLQEREAATQDARAMGDAADGEVAKWQSLAGRLAGELNALQRRAGLDTGAGPHVPAELSATAASSTPGSMAVTQSTGTARAGASSGDRPPPLPLPLGVGGKGGEYDTAAMRMGSVDVIREQARHAMQQQLEQQQQHQSFASDAASEAGMGALAALRGTQESKSEVEGSHGTPTSRASADLDGSRPASVVEEGDVTDSALGPRGEAEYV